MINAVPPRIVYLPPMPSRLSGIAQFVRWQLAEGVPVSPQLLSMYRRLFTIRHGIWGMR